MSLKEYIVTLRDFNDLGSFYNDMETPGGNLYIPHRVVDVVHRRNISRNTHYMLSQQEAELVKNDPRVLDVSLNPEDSGIKIVPCIDVPVQTSSYWNKSASSDLNNLYQNWGLLNCFAVNDLGSAQNWGIDGTSNISGTINLLSLGRNVDVVISDGIMVPDHPQWKDLDNPSVSRYIRLDWYQYNSIVGAPYTGSYPYDVILNNVANDGTNNHGNHVAGTVAGKTYGWAKKANIYNIYPYDSSSTYVLDWIRAFHKNKAINPVTGKRNPTLVNMSYTQTFSTPLYLIKKINYQNTTYYQPPGGWTGTDATYFGLNYNILGTVSMSMRASYVDADIIDCINDGVILCGAAGNENTYIDVPGGKDYNNNFVVNNSFGGETAYFYHRGPSQGGAPGSICVGATDNTVTPRKASFSNSGPRIDVFAPGVHIISAHKTAVKSVSSGLPIEDPNGSGFYINKLSGTSMATPQVTGMLACHAETLQNLDQQDALNILIKDSRKNNMTTTTFDSTYPSTTLKYPYGLRNAPNRNMAFVSPKPHRIENDQTNANDSKGIYHPLYTYNRQFNNTPSQILNPIDPIVSKNNSVNTVFNTKILGDTRTKSGWSKFLSDNGLKFNWGETINNTHTINITKNGYYDFRFSVDFNGSVDLNGTTIFNSSTPYEYFYKSIFLKEGLNSLVIKAVFNSVASQTTLFAVALTVSYNPKVREGVVYPRPKIRVRG